MRELFCALLFVFCGLIWGAESMPPAETPVGWASVNGGTTGGKGGRTVAISDPESFVKHAKSDEKLVIELSGSIRLSSPARVNSNKTILGVGKDAAIQGGGLQLSNVSNVIIRNIAISDAADAINIEKESRNIWIDHCELSNCTDGLLDIKRGSDLITVSWNRFHSHNKTCLLGHSDKDEFRETDSGRLRVTYHHNFFDGSKTRHPRVRFAEGVHVFNNYYRKNDYGVASVMDAGVLVEGNVFEDVSQPTLTEYGDSPKPGRLVERKNVYVRSGVPKASGNVEEVSTKYAYTLDNAEKIQELVSLGAGVGKL